MSARPTHDLAVKTGEYQDRNTGEMKGRWQRIGTVFRHDDGGTSIKLDAVPVGNPEWDGWVSVFKREDKTNGAGQQRRQQASPPRQHETPPTDFDDDIPF